MAVRYVKSPSYFRGSLSVGGDISAITTAVVSTVPMATSPPLNVSSVCSTQGRPLASPSQATAGYALSPTPMATSPTLSPSMAAASSAYQLLAAQGKMATTPFAQSKLI